MTKGELKKVTSALSKIAAVEEEINQVEVWDHLDSGMTNVTRLKSAIEDLARVILEHVTD